MQTVTAEVEVELPTGKKKIEMLLKKRTEIEDCEEGKIIILNLVDGQELTGIFKGLTEDEDVKIAPLSGSKMVLGYKLKWIDNYFEEIKSGQAIEQQSDKHLK